MFCVVGCCLNRASDLSNRCKWDWHGALPGRPTFLDIAEPLGAVNTFGVKKKCAKGAQRSQTQGQGGSPGGAIKTSSENAVMLLPKFGFGPLSAIFSSVPRWQMTEVSPGLSHEILEALIFSFSFWLRFHLFIYCNIYELSPGKLLGAGASAAAWRETEEF